jgi:hypothetical protein
MNMLFVGIDVTEMMAMTLKRLDGWQPTPDEVDEAHINMLKGRP